jgi:hypothetical protein
MIQQTDYLQTALSDKFSVRYEIEEYKYCVHELYATKSSDMLLTLTDGPW